MGASRDYEAELRVLRDRVAQLESSLSARTDPLLVSLLQNHSSFLHVITPDGRMIATGRDSDAYGSVVGRSIFEFMTEASHGVAVQALQRACTSRLPVVYEVEGFGEDGEPGHVYQVRAVPLATAGAVEAIALMPTDITERVRLERSLRESNDSLRLAVSATGMGFWRFDVQANRIDWDARMLELFGIEGAPPDYATYISLLHPDDVPLIQSAVQSALELGVYPTIEHRIQPANGGAERWIVGVATVEKDSNGVPVVIRGGALDITERKHLTRQVERAERVQAVGQLAAGIAHNFNNLLAIILPGLAMAVETPSDYDEEGLEAALTAALRARDLVKNMFSLTTLRPSNSGEAADLVEVVRRTTDMCRAHFPRQIELKLAVEPRAVIVPLSVSDLEHLVLNLLTNARDAVELRPIGPACIELHVKTTLPGASTSLGLATLIVSDNGPGMTDETRRRIFEPFFTTKAPDRGTGLGLATVAARLRDAQGTIECSSCPGKGTTFTVDLPLSQASPLTSLTGPGVSSTPLSGRVLVVDDEPLVRATLRRVLELAGLEVCEAASAAEARELLESMPVDLVILDDSMPVESGIQALESFQARTSAPVMLFTGHAPAVPEGIAALVRKPAHPEEIYRTVQALLNREIQPLYTGGDNLSLS